MGKLQFDHVAVPRLVSVAVAFAVEQRRDRGADPMRAMILAGFIAEIAQPLVKSVVRDWPVPTAREDIFSLAGQQGDLFEDGQSLPGERYDMLAVHFHFLG